MRDPRGLTRRELLVCGASIAVGYTLGWGVRQTAQSGTLHFGSDSGGWYFARLLFAPGRDVAAVATANSGHAGAATRALCEDALARYGRGR